MTLWDILLPFEIAALVGLSGYLYMLEKRSRFLKKQEKRIQKANQMPKLIEET